MPPCDPGLKFVWQDNLGHVEGNDVWKLTTFIFYTYAGEIGK